MFEEGDLVLKKHNQATPNHGGKFSPTYEGPYVVKKAFFRGTLILADLDRHDFICPLILMLSYSTSHEGASKCDPLFYKMNEK